ncbi:fimbrial protein [Serratia sp. T13T92]|uniref:fimbrial protein n=1 Tax=Serratia sp. T13T92 TaxID=3397496 RepID=UPI0039DF825B
MVFFIFFVLTMISPVHATCSILSHPSFGSPAQNYFAGQGSDIIQGTPLGAWIHSQDHGSNLAFRCSPAINGAYWRYNVGLNILMKNYVDIDDGLTYDVYQTATAGIGLIIRYQIANGPYVPMVGVGFHNSQVFSLPINSIVPVYISIKYILTNSLALATGTQHIPGLYLFNASGNGLYSSSGVVLTGVTTTLTGGLTVNVSSTACQLQNTSITLALPTVSSTDIINNNPVNYPTGNLILNNCPVGVNVWITITDTLEPTNVSNILTERENEPSGIGIQILLDNAPINFGPAPVYKTTLTPFSSIQVVNGSGGGTEIIPISAQYALTGGAVGVGIFTKQAYINFSYP